MAHQTLFPPWPSFQQDEIDAVTSVLRSGKVNYWTGKEGSFFEKEFADFVGCKYAVSLANGSVALELALKALGIGPGDDVIVSSRSFIASASSIVMVGATPVFADVDRDSQNITSDTLSAVLTPRTKAVVCVHLAGFPCDMNPIMELAKAHGLYVVEDCAQAHGAYYNGCSVGSIGHVAAWSFCQDKIMTTGGEGGMVTTNDHDLWSFMWSYKDHGKSWSAVHGQEHPPGFRWLHESFGTNWRMTEIQAAIGRVQLKKINEWSKKRHENAMVLSSILNNIKALRVVDIPDNVKHAFYKYYVFLEKCEIKEGWERDRIMNAISAAGVPCFSGCCSEIYLEKAFVNAGFSPKKRFKVARELGETSLMFLVHPTLSSSEMKMVGETVHNVMNMASKKGCF